MKTAYATIKGFEVMRALRKGQAAIFNLTRDICGEARLSSAPSASAHARWPKPSSWSVSGSRLREREHDLAQEHHAPKPEVCNSAL